MHDYAIFDHDRASVGRWLGASSIILAGGLSELGSWFYQVTGLDAFLKASVATGLIYFLLHWIFNKYIWNRIWLDIPDLSGHWLIVGKTLDGEGNTTYSWDGEIGIHQTWKSISIHLKTPKSQSQSYTANLLKKHGPTGGWLLSYSYKNEPELEQSHELSPHKGYCEIDFDINLAIGKASYFNSGSRKTFGIMNLQRVKND